MSGILAMNQIGLRLDFGESVRAIKTAGYEGIGIWYDFLDEYGYERGRDELLESGLVNCVACFIGFFNQLTEADYRRARDKDLLRLRQAGELGARSVLAVTGPSNGMRQEEAERQLVRALTELAPVAEEMGIKIALEPIHHMYRSEWTFLTTLKDALRLVEEVDHSAVGIMFDTYHLWQEPGLMETIQAATGRIVGCQINDWRPITRSGNDRGVMSEGCIPLAELLDAVGDAGFSEWYDVEIFSDELWELTPAEFLDRCKRGYERIVR